MHEEHIKQCLAHGDSSVNTQSGDVIVVVGGGGDGDDGITPVTGWPVPRDYIVVYGSS